MKHCKLLVLAVLGLSGCAPKSDIGNQAGVPFGKGTFSSMESIDTFRLPVGSYMIRIDYRRVNHIISFQML